MELRDYQIDALQRLRQSVKAGKRKILLSAPTGSGKGVLISKILERASERNNRCLFLVHKREIVHQVSAHLTDLPHGLIMAGETPDLARPIQLASKDTLTRRALDLGALDLIVVDEAHRATAKVYGRLLERWPDARVLGFTATPARNSGCGLGSYFDELIVVASVRELTERGYLAPARYVAPPKMDMSKLKVTAGDYSGKSLAGAVSPILGDVLDTYTQFALGRRAVVFVPRVDHAILLADQFNGAGLPAKYICGTTPAENRRDYAERLRSGRAANHRQCRRVRRGRGYSRRVVCRVGHGHQIAWLNICKWSGVVSGPASLTASSSITVAICISTGGWISNINGRSIPRCAWTRPRPPNTRRRTSFASNAGRFTRAISAPPAAPRLRKPASRCARWPRKWVSSTLSPKNRPSPPARICKRSGTIACTRRCIAI